MIIMIKVIFGQKGTGKTKKMIDSVNSVAENATGSVIFIDDSDQLKYDVSRKVRYINVREYLDKEDGQFFGFLNGIIASNYDISDIFIDRFVHVITGDAEDFFKRLEILSKKENIDFYISFSSTDKEVPEYLEEYII